MRTIPSCIKDTGRILQKVEDWNEADFDEDIASVTADIENMYGYTPLELSLKKIYRSNKFDKQLEKAGTPGCM